MDPVVAGMKFTFPGRYSSESTSFSTLRVCSRLTCQVEMIDFSIMKTRSATVADLRNNFRRLSAWLENGESVEIVKRGRRFARLVPATATPCKVVKVDFTRQLRTVWGRKVFSDAEVRSMREAELGNQS